MIIEQQVAEFRFWLDKTKMSFSHGECRGFKRDPRESIFQLHILSSLEKQLVAEFKCLLKSSVLSQHQRLNTYVCLVTVVLAGKFGAVE
ncbi:hypothetical protein IGI04_015141 [Brassica rapa subsp. trilocularis]|uniref:Uncharacterized protein n=1 Tax=Brassica rapa subsp. trilocularis TaxID=1813537 RepID=A0ABQ7MP65_BRACM|nr:hypothetical protein IGI04_015141 [Brassica rapa subsp. trilocularis]